MTTFRNENIYDSAIASAAARHGVPAWVIKTTIAKESSFNPAADTGSVGLMQLELATAKDRGFTGTRAQLFDPATSIEFGTRHLAWLMSRNAGETWDALYAAYNSGKARRSDGVFVNSKGDSIVEKHVAGWRALADRFHPGWRSERVPFVQGSASPASAGGSSPSSSSAG